jgi:hypothetical protein
VGWVSDPRIPSPSLGGGDLMHRHFAKKTVIPAARSVPLAVQTHPRL